MVRAEKVYDKNLMKMGDPERPLGDRRIYERVEELADALYRCLDRVDSTEKTISLSKDIQTPQALSQTPVDIKGWLSLAETRVELLSMKLDDILQAL
jgi:hypothetical protein